MTFLVWIKGKDFTKCELQPWTFLDHTLQSCGKCTAQSDQTWKLSLTCQLHSSSCLISAHLRIEQYQSVQFTVSGCHMSCFLHRIIFNHENVSERLALFYVFAVGGVSSAVHGDLWGKWTMVTVKRAREDLIFSTFSRVHGLTWF